MNKRFLLSLIAFFIFISTPFFAMADFVGEKVDFFVDASFSKNSEERVSATLQKGSNLLNVYIEDKWWDSKTEEERRKISLILNDLGSEFDSRMFNQLTYSYGSAWDQNTSNNNKKVTILFHSLKNDSKGYFRNIDCYERIIAPYSNQREMIYLDVNTLTSDLLKSFVAHEFSHLIQFNQKERKLGIPEEVWLNELRAEYAPTIMGYNNPDDENNYLKKRASSFLSRSTISLTDWTSNTYDYGIVSMFGHYLVDHYGVEILTESLKNSEKIGIKSIEEILKKRGFNESFQDIFTDWTIASYVNNCSLNDKYCYKNENLKSLQVIPFSNFIPFSGESTLVIGQNLSNWSAHWQRFSGANKDLKLVFDDRNNGNIKIYYIIRYYNGKQEINSLDLEDGGKKEIVFPKMGVDIASLVVIVSAQGKDYSGSQSNDLYYSISVSTLSSNQNNNDNNDEEIELPFSVDKPLNQMNREELLMVVIRLIIHLLLQGKAII